MRKVTLMEQFMSWMNFDMPKKWQNISRWEVDGIFEFLQDFGMLSPKGKRFYKQFWKQEIKGKD